MVIHARPFNFLMQSNHMTMLTIFKLWGVGSTPFPTYTPSKIDVFLDIEAKTFYPIYVLRNPQQTGNTGTYSEGTKAQRVDGPERNRMVPHNSVVPNKT